MLEPIEILQHECQSLLEQHDNFWLFASLGDWSYEEGVRATGYKKYIQSWSAQKLHPDLLEILSLGINGNLARLLRENQYVIRESVRQSPSYGPDITFSTSAPRHAAVQVKMLFDGTLPKYYSEVVRDFEALGSGLLVVFFTQLPNFHYPAGSWYGKAASARKCHYKGIDAQYRYLLSKIGAPPAWPTSGPRLHHLIYPTDHFTEQAIRNRYASVFKPNSPWKFDLADQLRDARVGVAIWKRAAT